MDLQIFNFHVNPGISCVGIDAVTYRMDMNQSWNVPLIIWFDSGSSGNLKIIPILAGLIIALTSLFHANSNKTNNIQSDHKQWLVFWCMLTMTFKIFSMYPKNKYSFHLVLHNFWKMNNIITVSKSSFQCLFAGACQASTSNKSF